MDCLKTPGHGLVTDSLIMHGLVRLYDVEKVTRVGERYEVCGDFSNPDTGLIELIKEEIRAYNKSSGNNIVGSSTIIGKMVDSNTSTQNTGYWITNFGEVLESGSLDPLAYKELHHKEKLGEGRKGGGRRKKTGKLYTAYLPISFYYGKYYIENYENRDNSYRVCGTCLSLATVGLISGTLIIKYEKRGGDRPKKVITFISLIPEDEMSKYNLLLLQRFVEGKTIDLREELTIRSTLLYALSMGETLYAFDQEGVVALVWRLEQSGSSQRALQPMLFNVTGLLEKIAAIKESFPDLPRLVRDLADSGRTDVLDHLAEFLLLGGDVYSVVREISFFMNESERKSRYSIDGLTQALLSLSRPYFF